MNLGLRYERQTLTNATLNFAPRVGFVYDVFGEAPPSSAQATASTTRRSSTTPSPVTLSANRVAFSLTPPHLDRSVSRPASPLLPYQRFLRAGVVPIRSLYVRPGQSAYLSQWFPTGALNGYPSEMLNPYSQQWTMASNRARSTWTMSLDYVGAHTLRINRPLDVDGPSPFIRTAQNQTRTAQAANCTRPYWAY